MASRNPKPRASKAKAAKRSPATLLSVTRAFTQAQRRAAGYLKGSPKKLEGLLDEAAAKAQRLFRKGGPLAGVGKYLGAMIRMTRAVVTRQYADVPWVSLVLALTAIVYFVSPIDLIPDFIFGAGLLDDAAIIAFVIGSIQQDLDKFLRWEARQGTSRAPRKKAAGAAPRRRASPA